MSKYSKKLVEKLTAYIEQDLFTITEICEMLSITRKSFYEWKNTKPEFAQAVEEAYDRRDEKLIISARLSLQKRIDGYTLTETTTTYKPSKSNPAEMKLEKEVVKTKEYAPDLKAIKMVLELAERRKVKKEEMPEEKTPWIIQVQDEETKQQLVILQENKGMPGGQLSVNSQQRTANSLNSDD